MIAHGMPATTRPGRIAGGVAVVLPVDDGEHVPPDGGHRGGQRHEPDVASDQDDPHLAAQVGAVLAALGEQGLADGHGT